MANKRLIKSYKDGKRVYEICLILNHTLTNDSLKQKMEEAEKIVTENNGKVLIMSATSLKSYAYPIKSTNNKKGYYGMIIVEAEPLNIAEISRKLWILQDCLRVLVLLSKNKKIEQSSIFSSSYEEESFKKNKAVSYDDPNTLIKFLGERGKIEARKTGVARKQRLIAKQVKISRFLSLLPYVEE